MGVHISKEHTTTWQSHADERASTNIPVVVDGAQSSTSSKVLKDHTFYDMVLSCSLHDLCDPLETRHGAGSLPGPRDQPLGHWKLKLDKRPGKDGNQSQWNGHVVGILGHYNRGKTWVMGRLSDYTFPSEGMTVRTEGMSFKWISTEPKEAVGKDPEVLWHLAIDTAGFKTPVKLDKPGSPSKCSTL